MTMSDPIGDMLTRIRNGQKAQMKKITCPASSMRANVLKVLKDAGFIREYREQMAETGHKELLIELKYESGQPVIRELRRISKPGRRVYSAAQEIPRFYNGLGMTVLSTPQGVMDDQQAREQNVGGEVLCQVF